MFVVERVDQIRVSRGDQFISLHKGFISKIHCDEFSRCAVLYEFGERLQSRGDVVDRPKYMFRITIVSIRLTTVFSPA